MNAPTIVIATHNPGKLREITELVAPWGFCIAGAAELGLPEPEETGGSFAENAAIKSKAAAIATGLTALADDSGLVVNALHGAPGVHSARWAGAERNFRRAMARVERELKEARSTDHSARFVCALALTRPGKGTRIFVGEVSGALTFPPRGTKGFGYDPIFVADGMAETFGELDTHCKSEISHRARAFAMLSDFLRQENTVA